MASLQINAILPESIVDGPGLRYVIFTQGCHHHCPGCHNPQTHDPQGGYTITLDTLIDAIKTDPLLKGVTFSGGEPFLQARPLATLAEALHPLGLDIITYTGYTYEALIAAANPDFDALLAQTDTLIDGPFINALKDPALPFRGSSNQHIINL